MKIINYIKSIFSKNKEDNYIQSISDLAILLEEIQKDTTTSLNSNENITTLAFMEKQKILGFFQVLLNHNITTFDEINKYVEVYDNMSREQRDIVNLVSLSTNIALGYETVEELIDDGVLETNHIN